MMLRCWSRVECFLPWPLELLEVQLDCGETQWALLWLDSLWFRLIEFGVKYTTLTICMALAGSECLLQ
jgi:hypothetical protein